MRKFELIVGLIATFGIFLKIKHYPLSAEFIILFFCLLSWFYLVFSFALFNGVRFRDIFKKSAYKDATPKKIIGAIGLGWGLSVIINGGLFKLVLYPGAQPMLLVGLLHIGIILVVAIVYYFRNKSDYYKRIFKRIAIYGAFGLTLYLIPTTTFLKIYYANNRFYTEHPDFSEHFKKVLADPNNQELIKQLEELGRELDQMKFEKWLEEKND